MLSTYNLVEQIKLYINNEEPFLLTRCGDGESIVVQGSKEKFDFVTKRQFGLILSEHHRWRLKYSIIEAYIHSNIIGLPTKGHYKLSDHWRLAENIITDYVYNRKNKLYCSIDSHHDMQKEDLYKDWLNGLDELFVIGPRDIIDGLKRKFNIKDIYWFKTSAEKKFEEDKTEEPYYPNQYEKVCRWIPEDTKGKVLIFGAGVAGKICGKWWKDHGGIAVDVGSIMDLWYGKITRGENRGVNSYDQKYKL